MYLCIDFVIWQTSSESCHADYSLLQDTVQQAEERACPAKTKTPSELSSPAGMENVQPGSDLSL